MQASEQMPFIIGITGGIGSGKSAVTDFLQQQGVTVIDADVAARAVVEPGQPALNDIVEHFGIDILLANGQLNRRALRQIIFKDCNEKEWLEKRLHPKINQLLRRQLKEASSSYVVLVSPLLIETTQHTLVNRILVVDVPETVQLQRSMARDDMTQEQAKRIINSQTSRTKRLTMADDIIENTGTLDDLHRAVNTLHQRYLTLAQSV